jgi:hypothetical protein
LSPGIIRPEGFAPPVKAFFTTKVFGRDLSALAGAAGLHAGSLYLPIQKHTDRVVVIEGNPEPTVADAVITQRRGLFVGVQVADCVPILLFDRRAQAVGAVHAGWRGTAAGILKKAIAKMTDRFGSSLLDLTVALGPSIRGCCYQVGHEVVEALEKATGDGAYVSVQGGSRHLDLAAANIIQARSAGVIPGNIWLSPDCTHCLPEKYYSYRFVKGVAGRQYGFIGIP